MARKVKLWQKVGDARRIVRGGGGGVGVGVVVQSPFGGCGDDYDDDDDGDVCVLSSSSVLLLLLLLCCRSVRDRMAAVVFS